MAKTSSKKLTKYVPSTTIITAEAANTWYGGLYGSPEGSLYEEGDPAIAGHIHDGKHQDGHAQKISLEEHVVGEIANANIGDGAITTRNIVKYIDVSSAIPEYVVVGSDTYYYLDLSIFRGEQAFIWDSDVVSNKVRDPAVDDFVFGSDELGKSTNSDYHSRFLFDKSKSAFRAGYADDTEWNQINRGNYSTGFGKNNTSSGESSSVLGGELNITSSLRAVVGSGYSNEVSGEYSGILVGYDNEVSGDSSVILGGVENSVTSDKASVCGGQGNSVTGELSSILGGYQNAVSGQRSSILSGRDHTISTEHSAILSGYENSIDAVSSMIGAGSNNSINVGGGGSAICAGGNNQISGLGSFVGSGINNIVSSDYSTIISGESNNISDDHSVIVGGESNEVSSIYSSILGGFENEVGDGYGYGTIIGGRSNLVDGYYGIAMGYKAHAISYGERAYSAHSLNGQPGGSQESTLIFAGSFTADTVSSSQTIQLYLDGSLNDDLKAYISSSTYLYLDCQLFVVGEGSFPQPPSYYGARKSFIIRKNGAIEYVGGSPGTLYEVVGNDAQAWDMDITYASNYWNVQITGTVATFAHAKKAICICRIAQIVY